MALPSISGRNLRRMDGILRTGSANSEVHLLRIARKAWGARYRIGQKFGGGSFGIMHFGTDLETGEEVAVKLEPLNAQQPQLLYEAKLYRQLP